MATDKREYTFAQTFPTGTHAMWLYYWLASAGINPFKDAKAIIVPPPQMVANMRVGNMDGFCVGEPWGHRAIMDGIGVTAVTTQDIWRDHPEKTLGTTAEFVKKYPNTARAVTAAILEAGRWIDAGLQNKMKMAETVADKTYVNTSVDAINQRILGRYQNGMGKTWDDPNHMKFYNDGAVNFPYLSDGMWFLTQHKRWGLIKDHPDYLAIAKQINQIDIYKEAAAASKTPRAEGRDAQQQDDRRRGLGRQGPEEIRRLVQGPRLPTQHPQGDRHGQCRVSFPPRAGRRPRRRGRARAAAIARSSRPARRRRRAAQAAPPPRRQPFDWRGLLAEGAAAALRLRLAGRAVGHRRDEQHQRLSVADRNLPAGGRRLQRPVLPQGPERPGHRLERALLAASAWPWASAWRRSSASRRAS